MTATANYNFDTQTLNAMMRASYTSLNNGMKYVVEALKRGDTYTVSLGVGKKGVQAFVSVDNITPSQKDVPDYTTTATVDTAKGGPTVSAGISYSFGGNKVIGSKTH